MLDGAIRLSPRKSHEGRVPRWLYKSRSAKTKAIIEGPYQCPNCGNRGLTIKIDKNSEIVEAKCSCGFSRGLELHPIFQPVDYYGKLIDQFWEMPKSMRARNSNHKKSKVRTAF